DRKARSRWTICGVVPRPLLFSLTRDTPAASGPRRQAGMQIFVTVLEHALQIGLGAALLAHDIGRSRFEHLKHLGLGSILLVERHAVVLGTRRGHRHLRTLVRSRAPHAQAHEHPRRTRIERSADALRIAVQEVWRRALWCAVACAASSLEGLR